MQLFREYKLENLLAGDGDVEVLEPDHYGTPFEKSLEWLKRQYSHNYNAIRWDDVRYILRDHDFGEYFISYDKNCLNSSIFLGVI
jgi:predicted RNA-binding protein with PUA-like domain